jgi:hypothetical protein
MIFFVRRFYHDLSIGVRLTYAQLIFFQILFLINLKVVFLLRRNINDKSLFNTIEPTKLSLKSSNVIVAQIFSHKSHTFSTIK